MIDEHGSALIYDWQAHYGRDLRADLADLCSSSPRLTPWWVLALVAELPDDSALAASVAGDRAHRGWTFDRHLLAGIFDAVQVNTYATARVAGAKGAKPPKPVPRPGDKPRKSEGVPIAELIPGRGTRRGS